MAPRCSAVDLPPVLLGRGVFVTAASVALSMTSSAATRSDDARAIASAASLCGERRPASTIAVTTSTPSIESASQSDMARESEQPRALASCWYFSRTAPVTTIGMRGERWGFLVTAGGVLVDTTGFHHARGPGSIVAAPGAARRCRSAAAPVPALDLLGCLHGAGGPMRTTTAQARDLQPGAPASAPLVP